MEDERGREVEGRKKKGKKETDGKKRRERIRTRQIAYVGSYTKMTLLSGSWTLIMERNFAWISARVAQLLDTSAHDP